jgi:hypothetical protein
MRNFKTVLAVLTVFLAGYAAGNRLPFTGFALPGKSIEGDVKLEVKLVLDNGQPLTKIEVDVAEKPGPPPKGGVSVTDDYGVASFNVRPGAYVIYFNLGSFPKNLDWPEGGPETKIQVSEGVANQKTLVLKAKRE